MIITVKINGKTYKKDVDPSMVLLDFVREQGFMSVKRGCDTTNCGLCTLFLDNKPVLSCSVLACSCDGKEIKTLEGIADEAKIFAEFIAEEGADQCGFCSPGFIMNVVSMKGTLKNPTDDEISHYLSGNLCRCTGYEGQFRAIRKYLEV
ncbi:MAG: 2Fe-2S iron-sulfur cluster-binding protein [Clostridia bacterium]